MSLAPLPYFMAGLPAKVCILAYLCGALLLQHFLLATFQSGYSKFNMSLRASKGIKLAKQTADCYTIASNIQRPFREDFARSALLVLNSIVVSTQPHISYTY